MSFTSLFLISIIVSVGSVFLAYLYGRNTVAFRWSEYIALLAGPTAVVIWYGLSIDSKILLLYAVSAVAGFVLEYLLGLSYHKTLNRRLWTYDTQSYAVQGYTSWLTLPMWGIAGVFFWLLSAVIGL